MNNPLVSVIIPVKNLSYFLLFECLPAFEFQTYKNFEVIVLPDTRAPYATDLRKKYDWVRIIPTGAEARPPEKRDIGVEKANGEIIAFIDDDAYPHKSWLKNAVKHFNETGAEAICGPGTLPHDVNVWEKAFNELLRTWVGAGGFSYRFFSLKARYLDDFPSMNFLIKKDVFEDLGGFNTNFYPGEDSKLCENLVNEKGGKIYYSPDVMVYHHRRKNIKGHLQQHGNYGYHRGSFLRSGDKNSLKPVYIVPTLFFFYLIGLYAFLAVASVISVPLIIIFAALFPLFLYITLNIYLFTSAFLNSLNLKVAVLACYSLVATHIIYAINFLKGFIKNDK